MFWIPGTTRADIPEPAHRRGVVEDVPGLSLIGRRFLYARSSEQIHGVGRDAAHTAKAIASREATTRTEPAAH